MSTGYRSFLIALNKLQREGGCDWMEKSDAEKIQVLNKLVAHYGVQNWWEAENRIQDWVSTILIQQTTSENVEKAIKNLQPYLSVDALLEIDIKKLEELIRPAGFYRQKSQNIKELMNWYASHGANLETFKDWSTWELRHELLTIRGVGPETADVMLLYIFERNAFIADTYAIRLFNRLEFGPYTNYAHMHKEFNHLTEGIPHELCKEWHACIDEHGKAYRRSGNTLDESWL